MDYTGTYSPDDNKLRLYASSRLDAETFARVKGLGFKWAPKQGLFVAPMWTPAREDLLIDLCGDIGDEDKSLVQRQEERAERFDQYSDKRAKDAQRAREGVAAITKHIPFGQPILVGHHSERHARKDAERIENGMRKAISLWETSGYWERRAAGALYHAKYKELPAVRARRIKGIEADKRRTERKIMEAEKWLKLWTDCGNEPDINKQMEFALKIANVCWLHMPRKAGDREDFNQSPTAHSVLTNAYPNLYTPRSVDEVVAHAKKAYPSMIEHYARWIAHYENRLSYERAMFAEQGGVAADKFNIEVGGRVLVRGEWVTVLRVNKANGKISSVTTNAKYVRVRPVEEIKDYQAPEKDDSEKIKAAMKLAPLCNYPGEGFIHITAEAWDQIPKDYRAVKNISATDTMEKHRVRFALGVYVLPGTETDWNKRHRSYAVFLVGTKIKAPAANSAITVAPHIPPPERAVPRQVSLTPKDNQDAAPFEAMKVQIKNGVQIVVAPQLFPTPIELARRIADIAGIKPGMRLLEPSAGTGSLLGAAGTRMFGHNPRCGAAVAVEINHKLAEALENDFPLTTVHRADFLQCGDLGGPFDVILMNPPFENGVDIKHIKHAVSLLKAGGRLVAICANGPRQNDELRPIAESSGGIWEPLPGDTFKNSGTNVRTVLLTIEA
jgi:hypothetical protein